MEVALGVYSFLIPLPFYMVTRSAEKAFIESFQMMTFATWIGLITHSVWCGIITGFAIPIVVIHTTKKDASE